MSETIKTYLKFVVPAVIVGIILGFALKPSQSRVTLDEFQRNLFGKSPQQVIRVLGDPDSSLIMGGEKIGVWKNKFYDPNTKRHRDVCVQFEGSDSTGKSVATVVFFDCLIN